MIVMGNFNARIGRQLKGVAESHGLVSDNSDNIDRLVAFACAHDMTITNTMFPHRRIHQTSWSISVLDTRVYRGADIDSDHRLVACKVKLKWRRRQEQE